MDTPPLIHRVGRSAITVSYGDIITRTVDVIVSSDDVNLTMGGGVSRGASPYTSRRSKRNLFRSATWP